MPDGCHSPVTVTDEHLELVCQTLIALSAAVAAFDEHLVEGFTELKDVCSEIKEECQEIKKLLK